MNKYLTLVHWLLVLILTISVIAIGQAGWSLWQINKINNFISNPSEFEQIPKHSKALFAQAFSDVEQDMSAQALEYLTTVLAETANRDLEAAAYFNRGNIHLREALVLEAQAQGRIALLGLAKQDYRTALLLKPALWDARFNLEFALLMAPESAAVARARTKKKGATVVVKAVGFRVDLP